MEFQPGDVVQLKSGGPLMTIEKLGNTNDGSAAVWVVWIEKVGSKQVVGREIFAPVLLEKYEPSAMF